MRHRVHGRRLSRDTGRRNALRRNMIADLITHEQVLTTEPKARMLRPAAEKVITLAKRAQNADEAGQVHARRIAASRLDHDKEIVRKLFDELAPRYSNRPGGYTRMFKLPPRTSDSAEMVVLELVEE